MIKGSFFDELLFWDDLEAKSGYSNMAYDEALLRCLELNSALPILRIYRWQGNWASLGYFNKLSEAESLQERESCELVRRITGGGIVDHRVDLTYTLIIPRGHATFQVRREESYLYIHNAIQRALGFCGVEAFLQKNKGSEGSQLCFEKPVLNDLLDGGGAKIAGAAQRRTKEGLLHQGSIIAKDVSLDGELAQALANKVVSYEPSKVVHEMAANLEGRRYSRQEWLLRWGRALL